ncbi:MAG: alpha/beta hydrolase [Oligoflexia bacterium]|nr:alpha/beta hydrolase [Oligoflexia bacterium]
MSIELVHHKAENRASGGAERPPLLFVHGSFCGGFVWEEYFLPYFAAQGFDCYAFDHGGRHGRASGNGLGTHGGSLKDYVSHLKDAVAQVGRPPLLVAHSLGGIIAQKYIEQHEVPGVVFLAPASPFGLAGSMLHMTVHSPVLLWQLNVMQWLGTRFVNPRLFARELFAAEPTQEQLDQFVPRTRAEPVQVVLESIMPNLPAMGQRPFPSALVIGGDRDAFVPAYEFRRTATLYKAELQLLAGANHMLMLDSCWQDVAERAVKWIERTLAKAKT